MQYDDRLATVLRTRSASAAVARIQFKQLIDLIGTSPAEVRSELIDQAHVRLSELSRTIPASERAAALGVPGLRLRSPRLVAALLCSEPPVAAAAVRAAELSEAQWLDLVPALPGPARGALRARRDYPDAVRALLARLGIGELALGDGSRAADPMPEPVAVEPLTLDDAVPEPVVAPLVEASPEVVASPPPRLAVVASNPPEPAAPAPSGIGAIVERIAAFRRAREGAVAAAADEHPRLPLDDRAPGGATVFDSLDFSTDGAGRIDWSEGESAPMLWGLSLAALPELQALVRRRQPLRGVAIRLEGAPAIAGAWQIDAVARFDPSGGRFTGYVGRLRRLAEAAPAAPAVDAGADGLRQVLHELRTPVNAIQGFAEIIQHQLYGPTPHEYRALSAVIVADAARILAGFEELDRLARLGTGAMALAEGECDMAGIVSAACERLHPHAAAHGFVLACEGEREGAIVGIGAVEAERLAWRLLTTVASTAQAGETLVARLATDGAGVTLALPLPAALATLDDSTLFGSAAPATGALGGMFGSGFALRLARAEARAAGGFLRRDKEMVNLYLPLLTKVAGTHSHGDTGRAREGAPAA